MKYKCDNPACGSIVDAMKKPKKCSCPTGKFEFLGVNERKTKKFFVDTTKYNWLLDPNRETNKIKVEFLKDCGEHRKGDRRIVTTEEFLLYRDRGDCKSAENTNAVTIPAFEDFERINSLPTIEEKHREWLKSYEGLNYTSELNHVTNKGWNIHTPYSDKIYLPTINKIQRKKDRLVLEFDKVEGEPDNPKENLERLKLVLKHYGIGFIQSTHNSENSDHLLVEFTRDISTKEAMSFIAAICPDGAAIDENFARDTYLFPVLYAIHWKGSKIREMPIEFFKGRKIDFDSLKIPVTRGESVSSIKNGMSYKTFQKITSDAESLLENPAPIFKSLGIGIHINKEGEEYFYIGTKVYKGLIGTDGIVRSTGDIKINYYPFGAKDDPLPNEIKREGINYRYPFVSEILDYTWSNDKSPYSIKSFCFEPKKEVSLNEVYEDCYNNLRNFLDYQNEEMYMSKACDILTSYFLPCFEAKGRTFDNAEKGSGKTRTALMYDLMMFNPLMGSDISKASMFRIIEGTSASLIIDDFDAISDEQKLEQTQIIRTGYKKGLKCVRSGKDKNFTPEPYNIFNSIVINNVGGLDDITQDRCNTYYLIKSTNKKIQDKKIKSEAKYWTEQRDKKYYAAMLHWKKVKETYEKLEVEGVSGRDMERIAPILTIAKLALNKQDYNKLEKYEIEKLEQEKDKDVSGDWLFMALKNIVNILNKKTPEEKENGVWVRLDELVGLIMEVNFNKEDRDYKKTKHSISIYLGKVFRNTPLFKSGKVHGGFVRYELKGESVKKFIEIRGYTKYFQEDVLESLSIQPNQSIQPIQPIQPNHKQPIQKKKKKNSTYTDLHVKQPLGEVGEVGEVGCGHAKANKNNQFCPKCNAPMVENKCFGGCE